MRLLNLIEAVREYLEGSGGRWGQTAADLVRKHDAAADQRRNAARWGQTAADLVRKHDAAADQRRNAASQTRLVDLKAQAAKDRDRRLRAQAAKDRDRRLRRLRAQAAKKGGYR